MTLVPGTKLGPYEVVSSLGAGGMGEVYRARDTTLHREVALKVLPEPLALDPDRLATGRRAFEGDDVSDTLAAVLRGEPDWTVLPSDVPAAIRVLLKRCLQKDRSRRVGDISAALVLIEEAASFDGGEAMPAPAAAAPPRVSMWRRVAIPAAALLIGLVLAGTTVWLAMRSAPPRVARLTITPSGAAALNVDLIERDLAVTPDGTRIVYVGNNGTQLFVCPLDQLEATPIATGSFRGVFTSLDGQWVGFVGDTLTLKKVAISGGPAVTVAAMGAGSRGATWLPDNAIIFATNNPTTGLQRVPAAGGAVTVLTRPNRDRGEVDHLWPEGLPGGRAVLFTITAVAVSSGLDAAQVPVLDLATGTQTTLVRGGSHARYVASGHLVYIAGGTLRAVAFDLDRLVVRGTPVPVVPRLVTNAFGAGDFAVAGDGTLVYVDAPGGGTSMARTLVWVDRHGREEPLAVPTRAYQHPALSPDGTRIAVSSVDQEQDLWRWDLPRGPLTRLTFESALDTFPVWTPDGRRLVFSTMRAGRASNLYWQAADGTGAAERLTESSNAQRPTSITPDGTGVVFFELTPTRARDLRLLTLGPERRVTSLLETRFNELNGVVSSDGRWLAYESDSSGQYEIYVRPFPNVGEGQWQVSTGGGARPQWARSGRELFYVTPYGPLMAIPVDTRAAGWHAGSPAKVVEGRYAASAIGNPGRNYDVSPDGQRFLMIKQAGADPTATPPHIVVVLNWIEELKRLVPVK